MKSDFITTTSPALTNIVTETHFQPDDRDAQGRMGRLISFLASRGIGYGIACSWSTAVDINPDGSATVVADKK